MKFDRVAVTGGSGRLGRHVVEELARHTNVTILDKTPGDSPHPFVDLDVLDLAGVFRALQGHDAVIHSTGRRPRSEIAFRRQPIDRGRGAGARRTSGA